MATTDAACSVNAALGLVRNALDSPLVKRKRNLIPAYLLTNAVI